MPMIWSQYVVLGALLYCFGAFLAHFLRLLRLGKPRDLSRKSGSVGRGVAYANTVAMMPSQKESAKMHLPTYMSGIVYHLGTFLSLLLMVLLFFHPVVDFLIDYTAVTGILVGCLSVSCAFGFGLFFKRLFSSALRPLSNLDGYLSNLIVTCFQLFTLLYLLCLDGTRKLNAYNLVTALMLLYMPMGKLRHVLYYFSARFHLGFFYGWRNVWPPQKEK